MKEASASFLGTVTEAVDGDFFRVAVGGAGRYYFDGARFRSARGDKKARFANMPP
jgi:hypothetical protein